MRVVIILEISDISGGGGVERQFIQFLRYASSRGDFVRLLCTKASKERVKKFFPDFPSELVIGIPEFRNRSDLFLAKTLIWFWMKRLRIDLVHVANFNRFYRPWYDFVKEIGLPVTLNLIDSRYIQEQQTNRYADLNESLGSGLFDGVYSWYKAPIPLLKELNTRLRVRSAKYCFTNLKKFHPDEHKKPMLVWAGRLEPVKRPELMVEVLKVIHEKRPDITSGWSFYLYGNGSLNLAVLAQIKKLGLERIVQTGYRSDLDSLYNESSIFVSTQDYENFTSLSMLEAMASANAIIAWDVGQTNYFVRQGENGILIEHEDVNKMANEIMRLIDSPKNLEMMQRTSRDIALNEHNVDNFRSDIFEFWNDLRT